MTGSTVRIADVILVREVTAWDLGLHYTRETLSETVIGDREEKRFETLRVYENKPEALRAKAVREAARIRLMKVCSRTVLGLVCPASKERELEAILGEIQALVDAANREFVRCRVDYAVVPIRIEHDNARAQNALRAEIRRHAERLLEASRAGDPEEIRRLMRLGRGVEDLVAEDSLREDLRELSTAAASAARALARAMKDDADVDAGDDARAATRAVEDVARRFPWAAAFEVHQAA